MTSIIDRLELKIAFLSVALKDRLLPWNELRGHKEHLRAAVEWLKRAQDSTEDGGVSGGYFDHIGWDASYPETTGYIIPTFFDYAHYTHDPDCEKRAVKMGEYLLGLQLGDGSFRIGSLGVFPIGGPEVFDTGQIMEGLARCYKETKRDEFLASAVKAGDWIVSSQEKDGSWKKHSYHGVSHTFYTRVAMALLELYEVVGKQMYKEAASKNVEWALTNCNKNGWYKNCGAEASLMSHPCTHFIAYAAEGILECGVKLNNDRFVREAAITMDALLEKFKTDGWIRGSYDENWDSNDNYSCLTGDAQIALNWLRLFEYSKDQTYFDEAVRVNSYLKSTQCLHHWHKGVEGGIKGSHPVYGSYNHHRYLSWAAKFFVDLQLKFASLNLE
jgi:hypothetical protein